MTYGERFPKASQCVSIPSTHCISSPTTMNNEKKRDHHPRLPGRWSTNQMDSPRNSPSATRRRNSSTRTSNVPQNPAATIANSATTCRPADFATPTMRSAVMVVPHKPFHLGVSLVQTEGSAPKGPPAVFTTRTRKAKSIALSAGRTKTTLWSNVNIGPLPNYTLED